MNITIHSLETIDGKQDLQDDFIQLYREAGWLDLAGDLEKLAWIDWIVPWLLPRCNHEHTAVDGPQAWFAKIIGVVRRNIWILNGKPNDLG